MILTIENTAQGVLEAFQQLNSLEKEKFIQWLLESKQESEIFSNTINPIDELFGIWKEEDIDLKTLREQAWRIKK
ncbi:MAG: hypothetical protein MUE81_21605 [Thermoflexibacter sp.]|jgi:hypothetical protein|nr:hypothetical protein [Thermoflexibacter sp.]